MPKLEHLKNVNCCYNCEYRRTMTSNPTDYICIKHDFSFRNYYDCIYHVCDDYIEHYEKEYVVEGKFNHAGFTCVVVFTQMGHRCGYVALPKEHPFYRMNYFEIMEKDERFDDIHGRLTFGTESDKYPIKTEEPLYWVGFDCNHSQDLKDFPCMEKYYGKDYMIEQKAFYDRCFLFNDHYASVKDKYFVVKHCYHLASVLSDYNDKRE